MKKKHSLRNKNSKDLSRSQSKYIPDTLFEYIHSRDISGNRHAGNTGREAATQFNACLVQHCKCTRHDPSRMYFGIACCWLFTHWGPHCPDHSPAKYLSVQLLFGASDSLSQYQALNSTAMKPEGSSSGRSRRRQSLSFSSLRPSMSRNR